MRQLVLKLTPAPLWRFLIRLGAFFQRHQGGPAQPTFPSQECAFQTLKALGWRPRHCLDVGAYQGDWARMFSAIFPEAGILMLEAQPGKEPHLKQAAADLAGKAEYEIGLLGAADGIEVDFV